MEVGGGSTVEAERTAKAQMQPKIKCKNTQGITYFGLVWKRNNSDTSVFRADDVIRRSKDGLGSSMKPICCLCSKPYSPDLMYIRCERCRKWFHGDALRLEEARIVEVVSYRCCRCRRRAIPGCPHSDDYYHPEPEPIIQESAANIPLSEEAVGAADEDPSFASFGRFEQTVEETIHADSSVHMESILGSNQEMNFVDDSSHPTHPFDKFGGFRVIAAETGSLYEQRPRRNQCITQAPPLRGHLITRVALGLQHQIQTLYYHNELCYQAIDPVGMHIFKKSGYCASVA